MLLQQHSILHLTKSAYWKNKYSNNERKDFYDDFKNASKEHTFIGLKEITEGQALTIKAGLHSNINGPVIINSCDQGILYDEDKFNELFKDSDIIICGLKNYTAAINKPTSP